MPPRFSLTEGSIPRARWCSTALLDRWQADAIWWSFPLASLSSLLMSSAYDRFGGWRKIRMGVAEARPVPVPAR